MISKEIKELVSFLILKFNDSVGHNCMASYGEKEKLKSIIENIDAGTITFDSADFASIEFKGDKND